MATLKIEVIQEDIDKGVMGDQYSCPIARALKRLFPDAHTVVARPDYLKVMNGSYIHGTPYPSFTYYDTSQEMKDYMRSFDRGNPVRPHRFVVREA